MGVADRIIEKLKSLPEEKQTEVELDEIIGPEDKDFRDSGLKTTSVIRTSRLAVIEREVLLGKLGNI